MSNDNFANAVVLAGTTFVGNNTGYTTEVDEPDAEDTGGWATAWHIWITPDDFVGDAIIDTVGSSFDTYLWIYTGTAIDDLTEVASDDDGADVNNNSKIIYNPQAATVYYIRVGGYDEGEEGEYVLHYPYTTGTGAAPAAHNIQGDPFDSTYVQGQTGNVQVNDAVTSGFTFDSTRTGAGPGSDIVPVGPVTFDTSFAIGGTSEIRLTIDQSETMETSFVSEPYNSPAADPAYRAPDQFGPGLVTFDSTRTDYGFTDGSDLRETVDSSVTADSYTIAATPFTNSQVPSQPNTPTIYEGPRGIWLYWDSVEDISGAPTLDYEIYLSDGTTQRAGRYGSYDNHYYGTFVACQSSVEVRARLVARNRNGFSEPSGWSNSAIPFNSDETGFGMAGKEFLTRVEGVYQADGTLLPGTGAPSVVRNIRATYIAPSHCRVAWDVPAEKGGSEINGYYLTVLENGGTFTQQWLSEATLDYTVATSEGKEYTFLVWAYNDDGNWSPTPEPVFEGLNVEGVTTGPGRPTNAVVSENATGQTVSFSWSAPVDEGSTPIDGYSVLFYADSDPSTPVFSSPQEATALSASVTSGSLAADLNKGDDYFITVTASNAQASGQPSDASPTFLYFVAPDAPSAVTGIAGNHQVALSWTGSVSNGGKAITKYIITPYIGAVAQTPVDSTGTGTTKTVTGLTNATAYTFKVQAFNGGTSNYSTASAAITPVAP